MTILAGAASGPPTNSSRTPFERLKNWFGDLRQHRQRVGSQQGHDDEEIAALGAHRHRGQARYLIAPDIALQDRRIDADHRPLLGAVSLPAIALGHGAKDFRDQVVAAIAIGQDRDSLAGNRWCRPPGPP